MKGKIGIELSRLYNYCYIKAVARGNVIWRCHLMGKHTLGIDSYIEACTGVWGWARQENME